MPLAVFYIESEKQSACDGNIIGRHAGPCRPGQGTIIIREGMDPVRSAENVVRPQRVLSHYTMMGVYIGKLDQCRAMMYRKGEKMTEEGTLSIVMLENTYKVRYASNNPHSMDRQPYKCTDEAKLGAFLQHLEIDAWYIQQAFAELWKGGFVALPIRLSAEQIQKYFLLLQRDSSVLPMAMVA